MMKQTVQCKFILTYLLCHYHVFIRFLIPRKSKITNLHTERNKNVNNISIYFNYMVNVKQTTLMKTKGSTFNAHVDNNYCEKKVHVLYTSTWVNTVYETQVLLTLQKKMFAWDFCLKWH